MLQLKNVHDLLNPLGFFTPELFVSSCLALHDFAFRAVSALTRCGSRSFLHGFLGLIPGCLLHLFVLVCPELCPLPGVAACERVSPAPRAPNSHHLCNATPWFCRGLGCLDGLLDRPRADPRVPLCMLTLTRYSSARNFACCAWSAGLNSIALLPLPAPCVEVGGSRA